MSELRQGLHALLDHALNLIEDFKPGQGNARPVGKDAAMREALESLNEISYSFSPAIAHVFHVAANGRTYPGTPDADSHDWAEGEVYDSGNPSQNRDGCAAVLAGLPAMLPAPLSLVLADALIGASIGEQAPLITPEKKGSSKRNDQRWREQLRTDLGRFMCLLIGLSGMKATKGGLAAARRECAMVFDIDVRTMRKAPDRDGWEDEITYLEATLATQAGAALAGADWEKDARQWWKNWCVGLGCETVEDIARILSGRYSNLFKKSDNLSITIDDKIKGRSLELIRGR